MNTPDLLTAYETCDRKGFWSRDYQQRCPDGTEILRRGITAGLTERDRDDFGTVAGEAVMNLAADLGMEIPSSRHLYESVIHHAALADTLTTAIRRPQDRPWEIPELVSGIDGWKSAAFLNQSGTGLRRIVLASSWNDERHYSELRSWHSLGEVAAYRLPMTLVVLILGQHRDGRRSGPWTKGFLHPQNHKLRFRKKAKVESETFSDRWEKVWREDRGEIDTHQWLQAMLDDDILRDVCFTIDLAVPPATETDKIRDMAKRKLDRLAAMVDIPEKNMSICDRPRCPFKGCCWSAEEYDPSSTNRYIQIEKG